jgi:hypothetical protein
MLEGAPRYRLEEACEWRLSSASRRGTGGEHSGVNLQGWAAGLLPPGDVHERYTGRSSSLLACRLPRQCVDAGNELGHHANHDR